MSSKDVVEDFCSSLCDLTVNSKPHINMLTMLAEDYIEHAPALVQAVEDQLKHVSGEVKLPVLYLIDSIVKNVGQSYTTMFSKNIANTFTHAFEKVDEKARSQMYKLRQTWVSVFPAGKLYMLDTKVNAIDPAWPITAAPSTGSIHLNPKFLSNPATIPPVVPLPLPVAGDKNQELLKQKKELLELQKRKVELELMQTKAKLEEQTRRAGTASSVSAPAAGPPAVSTPAVSASAVSAPTVTALTVSAPAPKEVKKIPPATNIISSKPKLPLVEAPKSKQPSVAAHVAPVRIRDPRLRIKESSKDSPSDSPEVATPPRVVLSPVPSPSNSQSGSSAEPLSKSPKKDKKFKKNKESRSLRKSEDGGSSSKSKEKSEKPAKLTRAEEVLRNLEEEQRLSKMQKLGSDTVINKAKQHEQMSHPKTKESKTASPKPVVKHVEPKVVEATPGERTPEAPPPPSIISLRPRSPKSSSPKRNETIAASPPRPLPLPPLVDSPSVSTSSSKENFSTSEESPKKRKLSSRPPSKTPSPPRIRKSRDSKSSKRKREKSLSPPKDSPKRKTPTRQPSPPQEKSEPVNLPIPEAETLLDSGHDTDLRLLTANNIELETSSPNKKAKTDMQDLFGTEDVDLRALPPPPPIISRITPPSSPSRRSPVCRSLSRSPERQKSWANLKRSNSDNTSPDVSKRPHRMPNERRKSDRFMNDKEGADEELSFDDPAYEERAKERAEMIMKHAEEQLSNGNITFAQYNSLLKEVITMNEKRKLQEAIRLDAEEFDFDNGKSPSPEPQEPEVEPANVYNKRRKVVDENQSPRSDRDGSRDDTPPPLPPPPPELTERDFLPRQDPRLRDDDRRRYGMDGRRDRGVPRFEPGRMPPKGPWMVNQPPMPPVRGVMRTRDKFGRWPPMVGPGRPPFDGGKPMRFGPPMMNNFGGGPSSVPPADPAVLDMIANDPMKTINIDGVPREIRFYGETAIIMMAWDDPRELNFQPGTSRVTFNDRESFVLSFNAPYKDVYVDGMYAKVRLGAPTRELFVDGVHYEGIFNGPPIQVRIGNRIQSVRLQGKLPNVKIGTEQRKDLVAGKVTLIVDANDIFPIYLDAKPQRFDIGGAPYILRFVEALQTVVINGVPFKIEFGSNLPVPMFFHGVKHYLRFSNLPPGVKPGYVTIINMEGGRLPSPPPLLPPPPLLADPTLISPVHPPDVIIAEIPENVTETVQKPVEPAPRPQPEQPLELLASLMPTVFTPGIGQGYTVEENSNHPPETATTSPASTTTTSTSDLSSINVSELLKKLVAVGIVPASDKKEEKKEEVTTEIIPVSFERPDSLKTRQPGLVHLLYSGMQCSSCGVRFPPEQTGKYSQHLDWHFRQNRRERDAMRVAQSRRWNYDVSDWIQYQEIEEKEDRAQSWFEIQEKRNFETEEATEDEQSVPTGEKGENACCDICQDKFDQFYNEEKEEWHLRKAIEVDGKLYHPLCHKDREEKLQNSVVEVTQLDKSVLLVVPTEEPELIVIPDDNVSNDPVLCMPIDQEKVETIDLDSEQSNSKDGQDEKEEADGQESDDDILGIEDVKPQIETVDLSEELDKIDEVRQEENEDKGEEEPKDEEVVIEDMEIDLSKVKSEKVEVVDLDAHTSQPLVVSSIDGNVELEDAAPVSLPGRIVINIPSAVPKPKPPEEPPQEVVPPKSPPVAPPVLVASEPPPPGEELYPLSVKPRLSEVDLKILQPVNKGTELSALCSIM